MVIVPVDTYLEDCVEMALSSGLLDMMACALLISAALAGADATLVRETPVAGELLVGMGFAATGATVLGRVVSATLLGLVCGTEKASSASFSATRCPKSFAGCGGDWALSKSNLDPLSCRRENWSRVGKRDESSSAGPLLMALESRAAKGSPLVTRIGDGLGFCATGGACVAAGGRPLRMGTISGTTCC